MQTEGQKCINEIDECINSVSNIFETQKKHLSADLNFFENVFKTLSIGVNELNMINEQQPGDKAVGLKDELVDVITINFPRQFQKVLAELKFNTIPKLKEQIASHTKNYQQFNSNITDYLQKLKKSYKTFVDGSSKIKQKQQGTPLSESISNLLETGTKFNNLYIEFNKNIDIAEESLTKELLTAEEYLTKSKEEEYIVVFIASQLVIDIYNFNPDEKSNENETVEASESMAGRIEKIRELLDALRYSVGASSSSIIGMAPKVWVDQVTEPFYARVWRNFDTTNAGEVKASKKSLVLVKDVTQHTHWQVEKMNGEVGYFPCCLLEPLYE